MEGANHEVKRADLVGCEAFSRDGHKIGKVKEVIGDPESASECLVIKYGLFRDLVVPVDVVERSTAESAHGPLHPRPS